MVDICTQGSIEIRNSDPGAAETCDMVLDIMAGTTITQACEAALALAKEKNCVVGFLFNNKPMAASPDSELSNLESIYWVSAHWYGEDIDEHRRGLRDMEWDAQQPLGPAKYMLGDVVEFMVGGFGYVCTVEESPSGESPPKYAIDSIPGQPYHPDSKHAWHYEGDIRRLVKTSALRG